MAARKRPGTPLDAKQRALIDEQERLRKRIDQIERKIEIAPKIREQAEKRQREQLSRTVRGKKRDVPVLLDKRYDTSMALPSPRRRRPLKAERRQAQITFLGLCIGLALLLAWLYSVWRW